MTGKRLTPLQLQRLAQVGFALGLIAAVVLMLGPFNGLEEKLGLTDKAAHIVAFYGLTVGLFLSAPRTRRVDLALGVMAFGLLLEVIQGQIGRSMSILDAAADAVGVTAAVLPGLVERIRWHVRTTPRATFAQIAAEDPRRRQARHKAHANAKVYWP